MENSNSKFICHEYVRSISITIMFVLNNLTVFAQAETYTSEGHTQRDLTSKFDWAARQRDTQNGNILTGRDMGLLRSKTPTFEPTNIHRDVIHAKGIAALFLRSPTEASAKL